MWWFCIIAAAIRNASKGAELDLFLAQYLDDSLIISEASRAQDDVDRLRGLIVDLGFSVNKKKLAAEGTPADSVVYIGIEVDVQAMQYRVGAERLQEIRELTTEWCSRSRCTRRELESLLGKLGFVTAVTRFGRLFVNQLLAALRGLKAPGHRTRVTREMKADLAWWRDFLPTFNGIAAIPEFRRAVVDLDIASDASGWGFGAHCGDEFFIGAWTDAERAASDINVRELWTVVMAVAAFGASWSGKRVKFLIDNQATIEWIAGWRVASVAAGHLLRELYTLLVHFDIELVPEYINTKANVRADALSRNDLAAFLALSGAAATQVQIPASARRPFANSASIRLRALQRTC